MYVYNGAMANIYFQKADKEPDGTIVDPEKVAVLNENYFVLPSRHFLLHSSVPSLQ